MIIDSMTQGLLTAEVPGPPCPGLPFESWQELNSKPPDIVSTDVISERDPVPFDPTVADRSKGRCRAAQAVGRGGSEYDRCHPERSSTSPATW